MCVNSMTSPSTSLLLPLYVYVFQRLLFLLSFLFIKNTFVTTLITVKVFNYFFENSINYLTTLITVVDKTRLKNFFSLLFTFLQKQLLFHKVHLILLLNSNSSHRLIINFLIDNQLIYGFINHFLQLQCLLVMQISQSAKLV